MIFRRFGEFFGRKNASETDSGTELIITEDIVQIDLTDRNWGLILGSAIAAGERDHSEKKQRHERVSEKEEVSLLIGRMIISQLQEFEKGRRRCLRPERGDERFNTLRDTQAFQESWNSLCKMFRALTVK